MFPRSFYSRPRFLAYQLVQIDSGKIRRFDTLMRVTNRRKSDLNKCIGDDTKAVACQSLNCIKNKTKNKIWRKTIFNITRWNSYTLQCGICGSGIVTVNSHKRQHPAMWYVALGWHAIEFALTSAILEFYIWFRFRPHHRSRDVILHWSPKFYPNRTTLGRRKQELGYRKQIARQMRMHTICRGHLWQPRDLEI